MEAVTVPGELIWGVLSWMGLTSVGLLVAWARIEVRLNNADDSRDRLWEQFDELHPRQANPGHRIGVNHGHEEE